jgi:transposase
VVEIDRPKRPRGRHGAKSDVDVLDAVRAGREALAREHLTSPRQRGHREALRVLHTTRAGIVQAGADARRQLKALIVTAPSRYETAFGGDPGANSSAPVPGWSPHPAIRWSTAPPCGRWP